MRIGIFVTLGIFLLAVVPGLAQQPYIPVVAAQEIDACPAAPRVWGNVDYLLWWVKDGPLAAPLASTSTNPADRGALGAPTTQVLFGGQGLDYGTTSGVRGSIGAWLDADSTYGVELGGLLLERRSDDFAVRSNLAGSPLLAVPGFDPTTTGNAVFGITPPGGTSPGEAGFFITNPDHFQGGIVIAAPTRLWGSELNGVVNLRRDACWDVNALAGFRYLDLQEGLALSTGTTGLPGSGPFVGAFYLTQDQFQNRNQFYGGQVGLRATRQWGRFSTGVGGKLALGSSHMVLNRIGETIIANSTAAATPSGFYTGGILVQPTNQGRLARDEFAVVPEVQLQLGYDVTQQVRLTCGYQFLYWSEVARPGDQIDRAINPNQVAVFGGHALVGPPRPAPVFNTSDFWAQGLTFGLEMRF